MTSSTDQTLTLEQKHTGERLILQRIRGENGEEQLRLSGTLPPHRQGPPLHIHLAEDESGEVMAGTLSATLDGRTFTIPTGGKAHFPRRSTHRWWNDGDEELAFQGIAAPLVDLDRYLQALFEVVNAGTPERPPLFYVAHVLHRHRKTQQALVVPPTIQRILFPLVIFLGTLLGKYRGDSWPGCPARCPGAPKLPPKA